MDLQSRRILVVDDHHDAAHTTAMLFRIEGYNQVEVAYNGLEAVTLARTFHPDVVVLDINMPVMDGYQAARALRDEQATDAQLLLVALTGRSQSEDIQRAAAAGFDHHLSKPLMGLDLFELIDSFFDGSTVPAKLES